ncbi:hypothetical protein L1887_04614 [Cichorium endivia]|nr:hypothetical protein L1887_04614 [Cichorium endivia]
MEIIPIAGYTTDEKMHIVRDYLEKSTVMLVASKSGIRTIRFQFLHISVSCKSTSYIIFPFILFRFFICVTSAC